MSVIINGFNMPDTCEKCLFARWSNVYQTSSCVLVPRGKMCFEMYSVEYRSKRSDICPLTTWIPCKERLPDKYGFYLVTLNNATTDFCLWNAMEFGWEASGIFNKCDEVTAWMPLPEPYTKEDEDDTVN